MISLSGIDANDSDSFSEMDEISRIEDDWTMRSQ
jgi:hypothetical protein